MSTVWAARGARIVVVAKRGTDAATAAAEALLADATRAVGSRVQQNGKVSAKLLDREQRAAHGLSWFATYVEAIRQRLEAGRPPD